MKYFFIGIKGTGMAALACILYDAGNQVSGSDLTDRHFFTEGPLLQRGISIVPFSPANIQDNTTVIIGNAFLDDFEEVKAARANPTVTCFRYHQFLGTYLQSFHTIAVAGSHGKTTTTGMTAALLGCWEKTGYLIGDGSGHIDDSATDFVLEADEYRNHFLAYHPDVAIITNMDWDHVDFFETEQSYWQAFDQFARQVSRYLLVYSGDLHAASLTSDAEIIYYGSQPSDQLQAVNIVQTASDMSYNVIYKGSFFGHFSLPLVGMHLVYDSLAVIGVGIIKNYSAAAIQQGLDGYHGVKRRFVIEQSGANIYVDDYAHHPTEVQVTLAAARQRWPQRRIVAVFKPHRAGRLLHFADAFAKALQQADVVCLCEFTSIDDQQDGVDIDITYLADRIKGSLVFHETEQDAAKLAEFAPAVFVFMSSKDIYPFKEKLQAILDK